MSHRVFPYLTERLQRTRRTIDDRRRFAVDESEDEARQEQEERNQRAQQELQFRDIQTDLDADDIVGQRQALDEFSFNIGNERILRNQAIANQAQIESDPPDPRRIGEGDLSFADLTSRITGVAGRPGFPSNLRTPFSSTGAGREAQDAAIVEQEVAGIRTAIEDPEEEARFQRRRQIVEELAPEGDSVAARTQREFEEIQGRTDELTAELRTLALQQNDAPQ